MKHLLYLFILRDDPAFFLLRTMTAKNLIDTYNQILQLDPNLRVEKWLQIKILKGE